jgi:hypothetical protein
LSQRTNACSHTTQTGPSGRGAARALADRVPVRGGHAELGRTDCGDNGGRGAFVGLVATAPLGAVGLTLFVLGAGGARGQLRPLAWLAGRRRRPDRPGRGDRRDPRDRPTHWLMSSDIQIVGREDHERARMKKAAAASAVVALLYVAFALLAIVTADADLLPHALVGLFTAAGARIALAELRRPAY